MNPMVILRALCYLCVIQTCIWFKGFAGLYRYVRNKRTVGRVANRPSLKTLVSNFHLARHLYPNPRAKCLHLAAAYGLLSRHYGWPVDVVIGVARLSRPFFAHAWVECDGKAVYGVFDASKYVVLDRL
ncbi:MAG TPA: lasso peptide biosynthesis B2 protein [Bryobacteraceae bacterium]|jgi:hypothetical protein|nr:lasso peptide biosynthesis B2 protein [Bryobacteraceae bacterium]